MEDPAFVQEIRRLCIKIYEENGKFAPKNVFITHLFDEFQRLDIPVIRDAQIMIEYPRAGVAPNFSRVNLLVCGKYIIQVRVKDIPVNYRSDRWLKDMKHCCHETTRARWIACGMVVTFGSDEEFVQFSHAGEVNNRIYYRKHIDRLYDKRFSFDEDCDEVKMAREYIKKNKRDYLMHQIKICAIRVFLDVFGDIRKNKGELYFDQLLGYMFHDNGLKYDSQKIIKVKDEDGNVHLPRPDYIVEDVVVELKRLSKVGDKEIKQLDMYMGLDMFKDGILINFTDSDAPDLEFFQYGDSEVSLSQLNIEKNVKIYHKTLKLFLED